MCGCAILICGVFVTFSACGFVRDLAVAEMPNALKFWHKNGSDALGRRVSRNADTFGHNARSEIVAESSGSDVRAFSYDAIGNRVWSAENAVTNTYAANCLNQYTAITGGDPCYPSYDPDGNMLTNGVWSYAWDAENRMTGAASNGIQVVSV